MTETLLNMAIERKPEIPLPIYQTRRGRPRKYTAEEKAQKWNDYIKNVYYPKHKEECRERSRQYYQRNKARLNSTKKQQQKITS